MTRWLAPALSCLVLGLAAPGCGGDDEDEGGGGAGAARPAETSEQATGGGGGKTVKVGMRNIAFQPKSVTVAKGGTVVWTNQEAAPHDVTKTSGPGPDFKSGTGDLKTGDTYKRTFAAAGTIRYECTVHPGMTGTVVVR